MDFAAARRTMVATQIRTGAISDPLVVAALGDVPRENFLPEARRSVAYTDENLAIGNGRFLMDPLVLAKLLQLADIQPADLALVVGSGYCAAVLSRMARQVIALEADQALSAAAAQAFAVSGITNVQVATGALAAGHGAGGPYDVILLGGSVTEVPVGLKQQLAEGGRLVAVVRRGRVGRGCVYERTGTNFGTREGFDAATPVLPGFEPQPKFVF